MLVCWSWGVFPSRYVYGVFKELFIFVNIPFLCNVLKEIFIFVSMWLSTKIKQYL